jgi:hypothetical protein
LITFGANNPVSIQALVSFRQQIVLNSKLFNGMLRPLKNFDLFPNSVMNFSIIMM